jgi:hypothetical protein
VKVIAIRRNVTQAVRPEKDAPPAEGPPSGPGVSSNRCTRAHYQTANRI